MTVSRSDVDAGRIDLTETTGERIAPIHPGEMLAEMLADLGVTAYRVAKAAGMPAQRLGDVLAGKRAVTADTSIRLGRVFGQSPDFWLKMQTAYEVAVAEDNAESYDDIKPLALSA